VTDLEAIRAKYEKRKRDRLIYDVIVEERKSLGRPPTDEEIREGVASASARPARSRG